MPAIVGLFLLSRDIIMIMGGKTYLSGNLSLQILCIALAFAVFGCFFSQSILIVNRKEKDFLIITLISAGINILLNLIVIPVIGIAGAAVTTVIAEGIVVVMCAIRAKGKYTFKLNLNNILTVVIGCVGVVIVSFIISEIDINSMAKVILTVIAAGTCYLVICYLLNNTFIRSIIGIIRRRRLK